MVKKYCVNIFLPCCLIKVLFIQAEYFVLPDICVYIIKPLNLNAVTLYSAVYSDFFSAGLMNLGSSRLRIPGMIVIARKLDVNITNATSTPM